MPAQNIPGLPPAQILSGTEQFWAVQQNQDVRVTTAQIIAASLGNIQNFSSAINLAALGISSNSIDCTASLNAIFAQYGAASYFLGRSGAGEVLTAGVVNLPNGGTLTIADDVVWRMNMAQGIGSRGAEIPLTQAAGPAAITGTLSTNIYFDTTGFQSGDWIFMKGCLNLQSVDAGVDQLGFFQASHLLYAGEWIKAQTIAAGIFTGWTYPRWNYTLTGGPSSGPRTISTVSKVSFFTFTIRGGTIKPITSAVRNQLLFFQNARNVLVEGVTFDLLDYSGPDVDACGCIGMQECIESTVQYCNIVRWPFINNNAADSVLRNSFHILGCTDIAILCNSVDGGNQTCDFTWTPGGTPSVNCHYLFNRVKNAFEVGTSHNGTINCRLDYNYGTNLNSGIRIRSPHSSASFNTLVGSGGVGGWGLHLADAFLDGTVCEGNKVDNFGTSIELDYACGVGNTCLEHTVRFTNNEATNFNTWLLISNTDQQNAVRKNIIIEGGVVNCFTNISRLWTSIDQYMNGLTIRGVHFRGTSAYPYQSGVLQIPANTTDVNISDNIFEDTGTIPCIYGPGATALPDGAVYPGGESQANWVIGPQLLQGTNGVQTTNMPTSNVAYVNLTRTGRQSIVGTMTVKSQPGQSDALFNAQDQFGNNNLQIRTDGKLTGNAVAATTTALSVSSTVADVVAALNNLLYPPASPIAFNFLAGSMPADTALTRASTAWYFNSGVALTSASADVARFTYSPTSGLLLGLLNEPTAINSLSNASAGGAVNGSPGTIPTGWFQGGTLDPGLTRTVVGTGTEDGIPYIDVRLNGTPGASSSISLEPALRNAVAASLGQTWTASNYLRLVGGSLSGISSLTMAVAETNGAINLQFTQTTVAPTSAALKTQRFPATRTFNQAGVTNATMLGYFLVYSAGIPIDVTLRVGLPQLVQAAAISSPIVTTSGAVTRAADALVLTVTNGTYTVTINRVSGTTTIPGVVISGGTYTVPNDVSPVQSVLFQ